jgi:hypothetical protein
MLHFASNINLFTTFVSSENLKRQTAADPYDLDPSMFHCIKAYSHEIFGILLRTA